MIQEITIRPSTALNCTIPLSGQYYDKNKGRNVFLLSNFKVIYRDPVEKDGEILWTYFFSPTNHEFNFKWDDVPFSDSKEDKERLRSTEEWVQCLQQHAGIENPDNKNLQGLANFIFIDKRKKEVNEFKLNNDKAVLFNTLLEMEVTELMDVAYSAMLNPAKDKMSTLKIFNILADFNNGLLQQNAAKFLMEWRQPDAEYKSVIRKAVMLEIIKSQSGMFKINNDPIGSDIDDLLVYFKTNTKMYEYLASEVAGKDTLPCDVSESKKVKDILLKEDSKKEIKPRTISESVKLDAKAERDFNARSEQDELNSLRLRAKALQIKAWQLSSKEVLTEKIKAKELENSKLVTA